MTIYKVEINEVAPDPQFSVSSYINPRNTRTVEYYATRAKADTRRDTIYQTMKETLNFLPRIEVIVTPIEVVE